MGPESYRAAAHRLRKIADAIEARAECATPPQRAGMTNRLRTASHTIRVLLARHLGRPVYAPPEANIDADGMIYGPPEP
jgi:hypothetical protein